MLGLAFSLAMAAQAGLPAIDPGVTPSKSLAAPRASAPASDTCDEPVLLVVSVPAAQALSLGTYLDSAAAKEAMTRLGGYRLSAAQPLTVLSGDGFVQAVLRFPCSDSANAFWNGSLKLQAKSAALYTQPPLPAELIGKVGDDSYIAPITAPATR